MPARHALLPLGPLVARAVATFLGVRLLLLVVSAIVASFGGEPLDNPVGTVVITAAVGAVDLVRRHETMLWANLGYAWWTMPAICAAVASVGEVAWALR